MKKSFISFAPYIVWIVLFTIAPTIIILCFSFLNENFQFTLNNIAQMKDYVKVILRSILYTTAATGICLLLAYPISYFANKIQNDFFKKIFIVLITLPMWTNLLLRTYSWMTILENNGIINNILKFLNLPTIKLINTPFSIIIVMAYDFLPFMILPIYNAISKINENIIEASEDLGANKLKTFQLVILPLSLPGVLSGTAIVFVSCSCSFLIPRLLGGGTHILIGELIESQFMGPIYNPWFGSAIATCFMSIIFIIISLSRLAKKKKWSF